MNGMHAECGICETAGHDRRTCPHKDDPAEWGQQDIDVLDAGMQWSHLEQHGLDERVIVGGDANEENENDMGVDDGMDWTGLAY